MKIKAQQIDSITTSNYSGNVYNVELLSLRPKSEDDLFWVANGIVIHNCFPKDLKALISLAKKVKADPKLMQAIWDKNLDIVQPENRDWEKMLNRAVSKRKK